MKYVFEVEALSNAQLIKLAIGMGACTEALLWIGERDSIEAWHNCQKLEWFVWILRALRNVPGYWTSEELEQAWDIRRKTNHALRQAIVERHKELAETDDYRRGNHWMHRALESDFEALHAMYLEQLRAMITWTFNDQNTIPF